MKSELTFTESTLMTSAARLLPNPLFRSGAQRQSWALLFEQSSGGGPHRSGIPDHGLIREPEPHHAIAAVSCHGKSEQIGDLMNQINSPFIGRGPGEEPPFDQLSCSFFGSATVTSTGAMAEAAGSGASRVVVQTTGPAATGITASAPRDRTAMMRKSLTAKVPENAN